MEDDVRGCDEAEGLSILDTIYAVSSGMPPAAIAVIRISGAGAVDACTALAGTLPEPYHARLRSLRDPVSGTLLDRCLVLVCPGPGSATGEDIVELHIHGGRAVIAAVMNVLGAVPGLRQAEPGEFTRRALMHGRVDLAQAEGLGDLLLAETEAQRRAAMAATEGRLSSMVAAWNDRLLSMSAVVEAQLDFADEGDVARGTSESVIRDLGHLAAEMATVLEAPTTTRLKDGVRVVLAGPPNSGKSTLFNVLAGRDAAIVSPIAGTTRDRIEAPVVHDGTAFLLIDTAGLVDDSPDPIELIGVERAGAAIRDADILIWLGDDPPPLEEALWLWARADGERHQAPDGRMPVSALTGAGIAELWRKLLKRAALLLPRDDQLALNDRQRALCVGSFHAIDQARRESDPLLVAESLRLARLALDRITGRSGVEAMLDSLFSTFCIGK